MAEEIKEFVRISYMHECERSFSHTEKKKVLLVWYE